MLEVPDVDLVRIGAEAWREFRDVRLAALGDAPGAFGASLDDWVDADEGRWRSRLTDVPLTVLARHHGRAVGVVSATISDESAELISMWVAPEVRGTGVSGLLVAHVVAWAAERDRATCLMVRDDNLVAIGCYTANGFVDHGVPADWPCDALLERRMWHGPPR